MKKKPALPTEGRRRKLHNTLVYVRQHWQLYLIFMLPAFLLTAIFRYVPMSGILIAFTEYNPIRGIWASEWVGFSHFTRFLSSPDFMDYLVNTLKLSAYGILWGFPAPIILAFLLNRILSDKTKQNIQLVLYMPNFISVIVLCGIVRILLSPTGMINSLLGTNINFMTMPEAFRTIYIASGIWQGAGWASIIYTAALSNASKELKEAAVIDGANIIQQIRAVEWPAIKDTVLIQFIMSVGNIMSVGFEKAYALQTDLNMETSEIIATYVYKKGLLDGDYGFSTAVGLFNTVINIVLLISIPVLYSGDEVGQLNDYTYHADPDKAADSRYVHRGGFDWDKAELRKDPEAVQGKLFAALRKLELIRAEEAVFRADARVSTFDTGSHQVLGVCRELDGERLTALFNFSEHSIPVEMEACGLTDLVQKKAITEDRIELPAYGFYWLKSMK